MPRARNGCRRRGIQQGLQRHKAGSKLLTNKENEALVDEKHSKVDKYWQKIGSFCFNINASLSYFLCAVRLEKDPKGNLQPSRWWKRALFYISYSLICLSVAHKAFVCIQLYRTGAKFDLQTFLCLWGLVVSVAATIAGRGVVGQETATIGLFGSWSCLLGHLKQIRNGRSLSLFHENLRSFQLLVEVGGQTIATLGFAGFSLIFPSLPVFVMPTLENLGLFENSGMVPTWCWRIMFAFVELALIGLPVLTFGMSTQMMSLEIGVSKAFVNELRKLPTNNLNGRSRVERLYIMLQIHNKLFGDWVKPVIVPSLFSMGGAIVLCFYYPIRHYELSGVMSLAFVTLGVMVFITVIWITVDGVSVTQASEQVVGKIRMLPSHLATSIPKAERLKILKRAKILRPIGFPLGSFGQFSFDVPVIFFDEIVNQLLFLLTCY